MDGNGAPSAGWWAGALAACATAITWFFSHFATARELRELKSDLKNHMEQYNKDRLINQQIYDVFVREGKIQ